MKLSMPRLPDPATMSSRERLLGAACLVVVSVVLLDRLVLGPWWEHTSHVRHDVARLEESIRRYEDMLSRKPQIMQEVERYRQYLRPDTAPEPTMAALIREVEALGKQSGVSLGDVKPLPGAVNDLYKELALEVQSTGTLEQWMEFVYLLQTSPTLFQLERATVGIREQGSDAVVGSLRLTSRVPQSEVPAASPPLPKAAANQHAAKSKRTGG